MIDFKRLNTYVKNKKTLNLLDIELQREAEEINKDREAIKIMSNGQGWKVVKKYMESCLKLNRSKFDYIDLNSKEALKIQSENSAFRTLMNFVDNNVNFDI